MQGYSVVNKGRNGRARWQPAGRGRGPTTTHRGWDRQRRRLFNRAPILAMAGSSGSGPHRGASCRPGHMVAPLGTRARSVDCGAAVREYQWRSATGYLADGITDDLTTDLARVPGLFVVSRSAAVRYKDQRIAPTQAAAELHVRYILEGSVRRVGDDLRINAQLVDARDGGHVWAERFDGAWNEVFALQDQVILRIARALELRLLPPNQMVQGGTTVPAAYEAYLRGREHYIQFWRSTPLELAKAVPYFEQAIILDRSYGEAYAALAEVYRQAAGGSENILGVSPREAFSKMNENIQQASKHPSARGYRLAAYIAGQQGKFEDATTELERAIALDPSAALNHTTMAWWLVRGGRLADSQQYLDVALRLDPRYEEFSGDVVGLIAFCKGHFAEAAEIWERQLIKYPSDRSSRILLVAALGHLGRKAEARQHYERANEYYAGNGRQPFTVLSAALDFSMKNRTDAGRIRNGLRKAGVPELPYGYDAASDDRLTADEIKSLIFGPHNPGARHRFPATNACTPQQSTGLPPYRATPGQIPAVTLGSKTMSCATGGQNPAKLA